MKRLNDTQWKSKYTADDNDLLHAFFIPALTCAVRYDRTTGYFSAPVLTLAARGIEGLVHNDGRMRLIVGCTLAPPEIAAIEHGAELRDTLQAQLLTSPLTAPDSTHQQALELLAWMVAHGYLDVKIGVPCDQNRRPLTTSGIFHEKAGIIADSAGNRLAFCGSVNETEHGWLHNWESFHVFADWDSGSDHVDAEETSFQTLWADRGQRARVLDIPGAIRQQLLRFLPPNDALPARIRETGGKYHRKPEPVAKPSPTPEIDDPRRLVWDYIHAAPTLADGGERVGAATCAITPWPHQRRAFERLYRAWPPKLLIADEVGLGKTIQAGLLLRQSWLAGRAKRILILAPKAVLRQWQIELREKFNLNWPIYDGQKLTWYPAPALQNHTERQVSRQTWHQEPCVLASSHLMRRTDRTRELLEDAAPWDLLIVDEAHHARRKGGGLGSDDRPNQLLRLLRALKQRTQGLVLLTATPMQVSPLEVWDLLDVLGLPPAWTAPAFLEFFQLAAQPNPGDPALARMAPLFRAAEVAYGAVSPDTARRLVPSGSRVKAKKILQALRDASTIPLRGLKTDERRAAVQVMKAHTPIRQLISRHTRELLRHYFRAGKLKTRIADRAVTDRFIDMSPPERELYEAVEDYISSTYNNAAQDERTAVGFVMTIYRRRLASSFHALRCTLENRLAAVAGEHGGQLDELKLEDDLPDDETRDEPLDDEEAAHLKQQALEREEQGSIEGLLQRLRRLPTDTKTAELRNVLAELRAAGYRQIMVFTQFTDTLDFLRDQLMADSGRIMCFSGRGGEVRLADDWQRVSRENIKKQFAAGEAEILLCTDAAAEGLNFQFCGALVNYDMPWNPMRVEQRIGRIDRLGQAYEKIRIVNLHYEDTVETDVYRALSERINLFQSFIGRLQPILARLPQAIADAALASGEQRERLQANITADLQNVAQADESGFDLDEMTAEELDEPEPLPAPYSLAELRRILEMPNLLLPPGIEVRRISDNDFAYQMPGMPKPVRVTTDPEFYDQHPESSEFWTPGSPLFPQSEAVSDGVAPAAFRAVLGMAPPVK